MALSVQRGYIALLKSMLQLKVGISEEKYKKFYVLGMLKMNP